MGVGVVIRYEQGRVWATLAKSIPHILDPTNAEADHFSVAGCQFVS